MLKTSALCLLLGLAGSGLEAQTPPPRPPRPESAPRARPRPSFELSPLATPIEPFSYQMELPSLYQLELPSWEMTPFAFPMESFSFQMAPPAIAAEALSLAVPSIPITVPTDWSPLPPMPAIAPRWDVGHSTLGGRLGLPEPGWSDRQGTPEDSLYRQAREAINQGEYRRAADLFRGFEQRFGKSRYVPAALYWQAFALYRVGTNEELKRALKVLDDQRQRYPDAAGESEVAALVARVVGALAARGDADASTRLKVYQGQNVASGKANCDREDMEVRAEALSALVQADPAAGSAVLERTLARREECTAPLRRRAVYLLGREGVTIGIDKLVDVAKNDPDPEVRGDAVSRLVQLPGDGTLRALEQLLAGTSDEVIQRAALQSLRHSENPEAGRIIRKAIERDDLADNVRAEAIRSLVRRNGGYTVAAMKAGGQPPARKEIELADADASYLRGLYEKSGSRAIRGAILETLAMSGGTATDEWLMAMVRNPSEDTRNRMMAIGRLRRSDVSIDEVGKLYDAISERQLRTSLIEILAAREEPAATDKLIAIAKAGTDPVLRRYAINALSRKKDPRTTKLLLELVEK